MHGQRARISEKTTRNEAKKSPIFFIPLFTQEAKSLDGVGGGWLLQDLFGSAQNRARQSESKELTVWKANSAVKYESGLPVVNGTHTKNIHQLAIHISY